MTLVALPPETVDKMRKTRVPHKVFPLVLELQFPGLNHFHFRAKCNRLIPDQVVCVIQLSCFKSSHLTDDSLNDSPRKQILSLFAKS